AAAWENRFDHERITRGHPRCRIAQDQLPAPLALELFGAEQPLAEVHGVDGKVLPWHPDDADPENQPAIARTLAVFAARLALQIVVNGVDDAIRIGRVVRIGKTLRF